MSDWSDSDYLPQVSFATWTNQARAGYTDDMRMLLRIAWLLLCLGMGFPLAAADWVGYPAGGAVVYVRPGQERLARTLTAEVREETTRLAGALGVTTVREFPIYAYTSRVEFIRDTGRQPDLLGESLSPSGEIRLDASGSLGPVRQVLAHELTHSLLDQRLGFHISELPTWVNEGIAGHLSDPVSPSQLAGVSHMIHRDGVLSLDELEGAFPTGPFRDAAYLQSRSMIAWLEWKYPGAVRRMVDTLAAGQTFPDALHAAAGLTARAWLDKWQQSIPTILLWLTFLASPVVYTPLAVLLIWAVLRRILRNKAEEADEDENGDETVEAPQPTGEELPPLLDDL